MNKKLLLQLLQVFNLEENYEWCVYQITVNGNIYSNINDIPIGILKNNPELEKYKIKIMITDAKLKSFVLYRLVDKLEYEHQRIELNLTQEKIPEFILNERFVNAFIKFLKSQCIAQIINDLESNIVNSFRKPNGQLQDIIKTGTELRQKNIMIRKKLSEEADKNWEKIKEISKTI